MRAFASTAAAVFLIGSPLAATVVKADDTTVIGVAMTVAAARR